MKISKVTRKDLEDIRGEILLCQQSDESTIKRMANWLEDATREIVKKGYKEWKVAQSL